MPNIGCHADCFLVIHRSTTIGMVPTKHLQSQHTEKAGSEFGSESHDRERTTMDRAERKPAI